MRVGTTNPLFFCRGALSAGIATSFLDLNIFNKLIVISPD
jgi:hypothetical protein